jgi:phospholipase C
MTTRSTLTLASLAVLALTASCGGDDATPSDGGSDGGSMDARMDAPGLPDAGGHDAHHVGPRITEAEAEPMRAGCAFERGATPEATIGSEYPIGDEIPIDHIIILMQENRSFDHYFGAMPGVDGIPTGASNPDGSGTPVMPFHTTEYCIEDVAHSWNASHLQYNDGANDGFVTTNDPGGARALGYLDDTDLPFYWDLYSRFAMSDHHFCSVLGPTWVNRFYLTSGTSFGMTRNAGVPMERFDAQYPYVIYQTLEDAGIDWRIYNAGLSFALGGYPDYISRRFDRLSPIARFYEGLAAGELPPVVWLDPNFAGAGRNDEHPPNNAQVGQAFVREIVDNVLRSPLWGRLALIITYDEHGGFYDHVPPPEACPPNDFPSDRRPTDEPGEFDRLGFRVPLVVVSPYARAGYVSDRVTDHASILRLVETRFLLPALTGRDANAWPLLDMFDFDAPPFMTAPTDLAAAPIDDAELTRCNEVFPPGLGI